MMKYAVLCAALACACRAIPLADDPTVARGTRHIAQRQIYTVDWWSKPLVKTGLLEYQPAETAQPAVDPESERVFVGTRDGVLHCLAPLDGHEEWSVRLGGRMVAGPLVSEGVVYTPTGNGTLVALDAVNGHQLWEYKVGEELVTTPVLAQGKVLIASQSEGLFAVDQKTGVWAWQYRRDPPNGFTVRGVSRPTVSDGAVYMGFADGTLVSLGLADGVARWERRLTISGGQRFLDVDTSPVVDENGHVFAASFKDGVFCLEQKSGDIVWSTARQGTTALLIRGSTLFASGDGTVAALETATGRQLWQTDVSDKNSKGQGANAGRPPMLARGFLVVPTTSALAFIDPLSGAVRAAWNPGRGVTATPAKFSSSQLGNRLYVVSNLGSVFALQLVGTGS